MIRVSRSRVRCPKSLRTLGAEERADAIAFYSKPENKDESFPFKAYKQPDVLEALQKLFHKKCAYCESSYAATSPADIEHFRPKGAIRIEVEGKLKREKPGYYWLAADWRNLLPSCIDCNRARRHLFEDEEDEDEVAEVRGKENKFPLVDEARRARRCEDEAWERGQRLLLDPCRDYPERHLVFDPKGMVLPRTRKGSTSIVVYALTRPDLKAARREHLLDMADQMDTIMDHVEDLERKPDDERADRRFRKEMDKLRKLTDAKKPYAGMSRQVIAAFETALRDGTYRKFTSEFFDAVSSSSSSSGRSPPRP